MFLIFFGALISLSNSTFKQKSDFNPTKTISANPSSGIYNALSQTSGQGDCLIVFSEGTYNVGDDFSIGSWNKYNTGTLKMIGEGNVYFSGGTKITGWEIDPDFPVIFKTKITNSNDRFECLWVNGQKAQRARLPSGFRFDKTLGFKMEDVNSTHKRVYFYVSDECINFLKDLTASEISDINMVVCHYWSTTRAFITKIDYNEKYIQIICKVSSLTPFTAGNLFYLENFKRALNSPGEWFLDTNMNLFYYPREGETISNIEAFTSHLTRLMYVQTDKIIFENIHFIYCGEHVPASGISREDLFVTKKTIDVYQSDSVTFTNCTIKHVFSNGISFYDCSNIVVTGCIVEDYGTEGIAVGYCNNAEISNNIVRNGGQLTLHDSAIYTSTTPGLVISHNEVTEVFYDGINAYYDYIDVEGTTNQIIEKNYIHHIGYHVLDDFGCIYTECSRRGTIIRNNLVHDGACNNYGGWGIYTDQDCYYVSVINNLAYDFYDGNYHLHHGLYNTVKNNIFAFSDVGILAKADNWGNKMVYLENNIIVADQGVYFPDQWNTATLTSNNNLFWNCGNDVKFYQQQDFNAWKNSGFDQNSIVADPYFRDIGNRDFLIVDTSNTNQIGFTTFDTSDCGVLSEYLKVQSSKYVPKPFMIHISKQKDLSTGFEDNSIYKISRKSSSVSITSEKAATGSNSLKITNGYFITKAELSEGNITIAFKVYLESSSNLEFSFFHLSIIGGLLKFSNNYISLNDQNICGYSNGKWISISLSFGLGYDYNSILLLLVDGIQYSSSIYNKEFISPSFIKFESNNIVYIDDLSISSEIYSNYYLRESWYGVMPITPLPTQSSVPKPTQSSVPKPTQSSVPKPTQSSVPKPTQSSVPKPTQSSVPKPTQSSVPKPTQSNVPKPTQSSVPKPTQSNAPKPTQSSVPKPTQTSHSSQTISITTSGISPSKTSEPSHPISLSITQTDVPITTNEFNSLQYCIGDEENCGFYHIISIEELQTAILNSPPGKIQIYVAIENVNLPIDIISLRNDISIIGFSHQNSQFYPHINFYSDSPSLDIDNSSIYFANFVLSDFGLNSINLGNITFYQVEIKFNALLDNFAAHFLSVDFQSYKTFPLASNSNVTTLFMNITSDINTLTFINSTSLLMTKEENLSLLGQDGDRNSAFITQDESSSSDNLLIYSESNEKISLKVDDDNVPDSILKLTIDLSNAETKAIVFVGNWTTLSDLTDSLSVIVGNGHLDKEGDFIPEFSEIYQDDDESDSGSTKKKKKTTYIIIGVSIGAFVIVVIIVVTFVVDIRSKRKKRESSSEPDNRDITASSLI